MESRSGELYLHNNCSIKPFSLKTMKMKNKFLSLLVLALVAIFVTSCYSSRKQGCPGNPQGNYKFRG